MRRRSVSSAQGRRAGKREQPTASRRKIDFSDIPEASTEQLRVMRRVGRPPLGQAARQLVAIRLDPTVLNALRREARRREVGYQTLINEILARYTAKRPA